MAESIKTKFPNIGNKSVGSQGLSSEWNGIIDELVLINAFSKVNLGVNAITDRANSVCVGRDSSDKNHTLAAAPGEQGRVAVGTGAKSMDWRATAVGEFAEAQSLSSTALGHAVKVEQGVAHGLAVGRGAWIAKHIGASMTFGSNGQNDFYFGAAHYHKSATVQGTTLGSSTPSNVTKRYHGQDAFDARYPQWLVANSYNSGDVVFDNGNQYISLVNSNLGNLTTNISFWEFKIAEPLGASQTADGNVDGGHVALSAGRGTGTGIGGNVKLETAPSGSSNNIKNALVSAAEFDASTGNDTRFLLLDTTDGTLKRVQFGADGSAGAGFKTLKVAN